MAKISNNDDKRFTNDDDEIIKKKMNNLIKNGSDKAPDDNDKNEYVKIDKKWITKR